LKVSPGQRQASVLEPGRPKGKKKGQVIHPCVQRLGRFPNAYRRGKFGLILRDWWQGSASTTVWVYVGVVLGVAGTGRSHGKKSPS